MRLEHTAFNVSDPIAMAAWYCTHLGLRVVHKGPAPQHCHFLADEGGGMIEIYCNPPDDIPDHANRHPLQFHLGWTSANPAADRDLLLAVGATLIEEGMMPDGSTLIMMRDPWGLPLQLCKRATALA